MGKRKKKDIYFFFCIFLVEILISKADGEDFGAEGEENPGGSVFLGGILV